MRTCCGIDSSMLEQECRWQPSTFVGYVVVQQPFLNNLIVFYLMWRHFFVSNLKSQTELNWRIVIVSEASFCEEKLTSPFRAQSKGAQALRGEMTIRGENLKSVGLFNPKERLKEIIVSGFGTKRKTNFYKQKVESLLRMNLASNALSSPTSYTPSVKISNPER